LSQSHVILVKKTKIKKIILHSPFSILFF